MIRKLLKSLFSLQRVAQVQRDPLIELIRKNTGLVIPEHQLSNFLADCMRCQDLDGYALYRILRKYGLNELPNKEWSKEIIDTIKEMCKPQKTEPIDTPQIHSSIPLPRVVTPQSIVLHEAVSRPVVTKTTEEQVPIREIVHRFADPVKNKEEALNIQRTIQPVIQRFFVPAFLLISVPSPDNITRGLFLLDSGINNLPVRTIEGEELGSDITRILSADDSFSSPSGFLSLLFGILNDKVFSKNRIFLASTVQVGTAQDMAGSIALCRVIGKQRYVIEGDELPAYFISPVTFFSTSGQVTGMLPNGLNKTGVVTVDLNAASIAAHTYLYPDEKELRRACPDGFVKIMQEKAEMLRARFKNRETYLLSSLREMMVEELHHAFEITKAGPRTSLQKALAQMADRLLAYPELCLKPNGLLRSINDSSDVSDLRKIFGGDATQPNFGLKMALFELSAYLARSVECGTLLATSSAINDLHRLPNTNPIYYASTNWGTQLIAETIDIPCRKLSPQTIVPVDSTEMGKVALEIARADSDQVGRLLEERFCNEVRYPINRDLLQQIT